MEIHPIGPQTVQQSVDILVILQAAMYLKEAMFLLKLAD
jgi:hypothetical protein